MTMTEEITKHEEGFSKSISTLNMKSRDRNKNKDNGHGISKLRNDRLKFRNPMNSQNQRSKKDIECWNCGKIGHYQNECRFTKKDKDSHRKTNVNVMSK